MESAIGFALIPIPGHPDSLWPPAGLESLFYKDSSPVPDGQFSPILACFARLIHAK